MRPASECVSWQVLLGSAEVGLFWGQKRLWCVPDPPPAECNGCVDVQQNAVRNSPPQHNPTEPEALSLGQLGVANTGLGDLPTAAGPYRQAISVREDLRAMARLEEFKTGVAERAADLYERATLLLWRMGEWAE